MSEQIQPGPDSGMHLDADQLNAFVEGALPEHEHLLTLAHLAECPGCRDVVFLAQEAAPVLTPTIVRAEPAPESKRFWSGWFGPLPLAGTAALAAITLIVWHLQTRTAYRQLAEPAKTASVQIEPSMPMPAPLPTPARPVPQQRAGVQRQAAGAQNGAYQASNAPPPPAARRLPALSETNADQAGTGVVEQRAPAASASVATATPSDKFLLRQRRFEAAPGAADKRQVVAASAPPPPPASAMRAPAPQNLPVQGRNAPAAPSLAVQAMSGMLAKAKGPGDNVSALSGSVTDPTGATVPGAAVTLHFASYADAGASEIKTTTGQDGRFALPAVPPGTYDLQISSPGFEVHTQKIDLLPNEETRLRSVLTVGAASATVEVSSAAPMEAQAPRAAGGLDLSTPVPSGLAVIAKAFSADRAVAFDAAGSLYTKHGAGEWTLVKPVWTGRVTHIHRLPGRQGVFQLTTDTGALWVSADGEHWHEK